MFIPFRAPRKDENSADEKKLDRAEFVHGVGKVPKFICPVCSAKAWYIGITEVWCSNKGCRRYHDPWKDKPSEENLQGAD